MLLDKMVIRVRKQLTTGYTAAACNQGHTAAASSESRACTVCMCFVLPEPCTAVGRSLMKSWARYVSSFVPMEQLFCDQGISESPTGPPVASVGSRNLTTKALMNVPNTKLMMDTTVCQ